jgi:hypothetical protein
MVVELGAGPNPAIVVFPQVVLQLAPTDVVEHEPPAGGAVGGLAGLGTGARTAVVVEGLAFAPPDGGIEAHVVTVVVEGAPVVTGAPLLAPDATVTAAPVVTGAPTVTGAPVLTGAPTVTGVTIFTGAPVVTDMPDVLGVFALANASAWAFCAAANWALRAAS